MDLTLGMSKVIIVLLFQISHKQGDRGREHQRTYKVYLHTLKMSRVEYMSLALLSKEGEVTKTEE